MRYQLLLGKYPVTEVKRGPARIDFVIEVQDKLFLRTHAPLTADIRKGDKLTLYTEVLAQTQRN